MKSIILILLYLIIFIKVDSQSVVNRSNNAITVVDGRLGAGLNLYVPRYLDTSQASQIQNIGIDSCGAVIFTYNDNSYWIRACNPKRWIKLLKTGDVASSLANNGLSKNGDTIQLGQTVAAVGDPALLNTNREIPTNGFSVFFTGAGRVAIGTTSPNSTHKFTSVATGTDRAIQATAANGVAVNGSSALVAIFGQSTGASISVQGATVGAGIGVQGSSGIGGIGGRFTSIASGGTADPVSLELQRDPTGVGVSNGVGQTIMFRLPFTNSTTGNESGRIINFFSNAVSGAQTSGFAFHLMNNAVSARKALLAGTGQWTWDGYPALTAQVDSTTYKPIAIDGSGNVVKMAGWVGSGGGVTLNNIGLGYRYVATPSGDIKTSFAGYGILKDSTTNTNGITDKIDTTSSNGVATKNYVTNTKTWPAEAPIGLIYNKNNWYNLTDFLINTGGGATTTLALNSGFVDYSVSSIDWDNYTTILPIRPTILPNWTITLDFKMITAPGAGTVGFGLGTHKAIGGNGDVLCYINTTNSGSSGGISINRGDGGATWATGTSSTVNQNDIIRLTVTFVDSVITFTAANLTTGGAVGNISYTNTLASTTSPLSLISNWALIGHSSTACTWQIQSLAISSQTKRNANLVVAGDSKTQGAYATYFATRYGTRLNSSFPSSMIYASGNATIADYNNLLQEEITYLNGVQYLLSIGSNDKRFGATLAQMQDRYTKLVKLLQGGGAHVVHIVLPEDSTTSGVGLSDFKQWVATTYANDYIDVWTPLSTNNILKSGYNSGDGIHPNEAANKSIDSIIVLSGKVVVTPINRRSPYRVTDNIVKTMGDSLFTNPVDKALYYVNHWGQNGEYKTGLFQDNGTNAGVSTTRLVPITGMQFNVTGFLGINGSSGGLIFADRGGPSPTGTFSLYAQNRQLNLFHNLTGSNCLKIDSLGRIAFFNLPVTTSAFVHFPLGVTTAGRAPIKFYLNGSEEIMTTPEAGAVEAKGDYLLYTNDNPTRDTVAMRSWVEANFSTPTLAEGTWTPTLTDITNVTTSSVAGAGSYLRVGSKVTFSVQLSVTPTAGASLTQVDITLPIASALANTYELSGVNSGLRGYVIGQTTNDRASVVFTSDVSGAETITVHVTYRIL